jgi:hypothetical protein
VAPAARAQESDGGSGGSRGPSFELVAQPATVGPTDLLPLRLRIRPADATNLDVRVMLHRSLETRSGFEETVAGENLGSVIDTAQYSLDDEPMRAGVVTARFGMTDAYIGADQVIEPDDAPGVYPLRVELRRDGTVLDDFVTWLVYVPGDGERAIGEPLSVVWVWSVVAPPARRPDGRPEPRVLEAMQSDGRLARVAAALARADSVPLTLAISPETLQSWLEFARERPPLRAAANAVRIAAGDRDNQLLPAPYVPIDLPAFERAGFGDRLSDELVAGADTLRNLTQVRLDDPRTFAVDPVDEAALARLRGFLVDRVLVREERLEPEQSNLTPARPFLLSTANGATFDAASTNPTVEDWLDGPEPAALRAQRFLAGLSLIAMEAPNSSRGIVVATDADWAPDVDAVTHVLRGLRTDPLLQPATLNEFFATVPPDTVGDDDASLVRRLAPSEPESYPITTSEYERARESLNAFQGVVDAVDPAIAAGERALLVALSSELTPEQARAHLGVIDVAAKTFLSQITITQQRVTLTARKAEIPLSFRNDTLQAVRVRVRLSAPSGKALFPNGEEQVITLEPGDHTERFLVEARATGTFAMIVTLTSEDGRLAIGAPTQITVRSTVFSGWGAMLTIGALVLLAGWWANHIWRSRRAMRRAAV